MNTTKFDKAYFFKRASEWMEEGDKIVLENGTYKFISGNTIILQWNEQNGYKEYYTKETTKSK